MTFYTAVLLLLLGHRTAPIYNGLELRECLLAKNTMQCRDGVHMFTCIFIYLRVYTQYLFTNLVILTVV